MSQIVRLSSDHLLKTRGEIPTHNTISTLMLDLCQGLFLVENIISAFRIEY